ncbi:MAG: hypothetical protein NTW04_04080, partial [Elusimicrobia bacterium]|nr:hypothetical protein [Elusimicrobiota bacterium]
MHKLFGKLSDATGAFCAIVLSAALITSHTSPAFTQSQSEIEHNRFINFLNENIPPDKFTSDSDSRMGKLYQGYSKEQIDVFRKAFEMELQGSAPTEKDWGKNVTAYHLYGTWDFKLASRKSKGRFSISIDGFGFLEPQREEKFWKYVMDSNAQYNHFIIVKLKNDYLLLIKISEKKMDWANSG